MFASTLPIPALNAWNGFFGKVGRFNTKCFPNNSTEGAIGSLCAVDSDCVLASCADGVCSAPIAECPSNSTASVCSGHGTCTYTNNAGKALSEACTVFDTSCTAVCTCRDGYGGVDCSLSPAAAIARDEDRTALCNALGTIRDSSDASPLLLKSLVGSLLASYAPAEVVSVEGTGACEEALALVTKLAAEGLLAGTSTATTSYLVQSTAEFVAPATGSGASRSGAKAGAVVTDALADVAAGVLLSMVPGQSDVVVATDGLRFTAVNALASTVTALRPPLTGAEAAYGSEAASAVEFISGSGAACDTGLGYAELSVVQWGATPYEGADSLETPQLQFQSHGSSAEAGSRRRLRRLVAGSGYPPSFPVRGTHRVESTTRARPRRLAGKASSPTYYLTFLFNQPQSFDLDVLSELLDSGDSRSSALKGSNATFPDCTQFSIESGYSPCQGCVVSSYNNINVTYSCFDVAQLCPGVGSNRRLQGDDDGDDDGDDFLSGDTSAASSVQYAALINTLDSVLSTNPFSLDLQQNSSVVIFLSVLVSIILIGFVYFRRWDVHDHHVMLYAKKERERWVPSKQRLHQKLRSFMSMSRDGAEGGGRSLRRRSFEASSPSRKDFARSIGSLLPSPFSRGSRSFYTERNSQKERSIRVDFDSSRFWRRNSGNNNNITQARAEELARSFSGLSLNIDSASSIGSHRFSSHRTTSFVSKSLFDFDFDPVTEDGVGLGVAGGQGLGSSWDPSSPKAQYVRATVEDFLGSVLPEDAQGVSQSSTPVTDFMVQILQEHDFTGMFFGESLQMPRMIRWARLCMAVLIIIFIDTLFFSTFFPDTGECESYETQQDCETPTNEGLDAPLCEWEETSNANGGECSLKDPPEDLVFTMVLVMLTMIVGVPLVLVFDALLAAYCPLRPDLDAWGLTASWWLSRSSQSIAIEGDACVVNGKGGSGAGETAVPVKSSAPLKQLYDEVEQQHEKTLQNPQLSAVQKMAAHQRRQRAELRELDLVTHNLLYEYSSPLEEAQHMVSGARHMLEQYYTSASSTRPFSGASDSVGPILEAKVHAVQELLGIYPDGTPVPLTMWELLRYGTPLRKLESRVRAARAKAQEITDLLDGLGEAATSAQDQDVALIQYFAFEQFTPFKRFILQSSFFDFPYTSPQTISTSVWLAAWTLVIAAYLFFLYWILVWGISSGNKTLNTWALNFGLALIEDIFVIQVVRIYVLVILAFVAVRPQLRSIYRVLYSVAIEYAQGGAATALKASEFKVVQHLSAACRAARQSGYLHLASATILHRVDDVHERDCRRASKYGVPLAAAALIFFPVVIGAVHELMGDLVFEAILPLVLNSFILANSFLYAVSILLLVLPYALLVFLYWWVYKLYPSASRRAQAVRERNRQASSISVRIQPSRQKSLLRSQRRLALSSARARMHEWWRGALDAAAIFVHLVTTPVLRMLGFTISEDGTVARRSPIDAEGSALSSTKHGRSLATWRGMNLPADLHAVDTSPPSSLSPEAQQVSTGRASRGADYNDDGKVDDDGGDLQDAQQLESAEELLKSLPAEVQGMLPCEMWLSAWHASGVKTSKLKAQRAASRVSHAREKNNNDYAGGTADAALSSCRSAVTNGSSDFAVRLLNRVLLGEGGAALLPQQQSLGATAPGPPLSLSIVSRSGAPKQSGLSSAASAYRSRFQSLSSVDGALLHLLTSYRQRVQLGQEVYISYLDQEELFQLSSTDLLLYGGQIHIADLASLLQELLEWCDRQGWELTEHHKKLLLDEFRHWTEETGSALEPFDMFDEDVPASHSSPRALTTVMRKVARTLTMRNRHRSDTAGGEERAEPPSPREAATALIVNEPQVLNDCSSDGSISSGEMVMKNEGAPTSISISAPASGAGAGLRPSRGSAQAAATAGRAARAASAASTFIRRNSAAFEPPPPPSSVAVVGAEDIGAGGGAGKDRSSSLPRGARGVGTSAGGAGRLTHTVELNNAQTGSPRWSSSPRPPPGLPSATSGRLGPAGLQGGLTGAGGGITPRAVPLRQASMMGVVGGGAAPTSAAGVGSVLGGAWVKADWAAMDPRTARCAVRFSAFARWLRTTVLGSLRSSPSAARPGRALLVAPATVGATGLLADTAALSAVPAGTQILPELFVPSFDEYEDDEDEKQIVLGAMVKFRYTAKHLPNSIL